MHGEVFIPYVMVGMVGLQEEHKSSRVQSSRRWSICRPCRRRLPSSARGTTPASRQL
uniref:Uncharacterized protein n=1 Tax=Anguilla anguilla TaxID=7936 RepID=A0A0E9VSX9_ANGAN